MQTIGRNYALLIQDKMTLMDKESWDAMAEETKRTIKNIKSAQKSERNKVVDEVLEILKRNVLFPPNQSLKIFKEVKELRNNETT